MKIVNLTPHEINIVDSGGTVLYRLPPSAQIVRVVSESECVGDIDGVLMHRTIFRDVEGLPEPRPDTIYVASMLDALVAAKMGRTDVHSPTEAVRGIDGRVVWCRGLRKYQWSELTFSRLPTA